MRYDENINTELIDIKPFRNNLDSRSFKYLKASAVNMIGKIQ